ncbi:MAG TPA: thiolase family protein [Acidimicrobiia bacterium]
MVEVPERNAIISGIGISRIGRKTGIGHLELTTESTTAAIADAGLTPSDIDGIATMGDTPVDEVARHVGGSVGSVPTVATGGLLAPLMGAFLAVASGSARHVLVYRTVQMMGGAIIPPSGGAPAPPPPAPPRREDGGGRESPVNSMGDMGPLFTYNAFSAANWLAMHAKRHMYLYGTTKEQLGWLAINSRRNAALNERAVYREPMTMDDYLSARPISDPFGLLDCDVPIDGSIAVVVSHADYAPDCPNPPVRVASMGGSTGPGAWVNRPDYPKMASMDAAAEMWNKTDLGPADVDVVELYDGFTFLTFAWLEALRIVGDGESGPFVEGATRIAIDGELPVNTYGGQLSAGRMHGYWVVHEACVQLRGQAGDRQVEDPEVAVASIGGGPIAGCVLLTR